MAQKSKYRVGMIFSGGPAPAANSVIGALRGRFAGAWPRMYRLLPRLFATTGLPPRFAALAARKALPYF